MTSLGISYNQKIGILYDRGRRKYKELNALQEITRCEVQWIVRFFLVWSKSASASGLGVKSLKFLSSFFVKYWEKCMFQGELSAYH